MSKYTEWMEKQKIYEEQRKKAIEKLPDFSVDSNIREDHRQILLCLHGFGGDKESSVITALRKQLDERGIGVAAFDWPAHGKSMAKDEEFRVETCLAYLDRTVMTLREKWEGKPLNCFATSFGGYITMLYLDVEPEAFSKVILRSPAIKMHKVFRSLLTDEDFNRMQSGEKLTLGYDRPMQIAYDFYEDLERNKIFDKKEYYGNVLILQGDKDDVVDPEDTKEYADRICARWKLFEGTDHRYKRPGELEQIVNYTERFLLEQEDTDIRKSACLDEDVLQSKLWPLYYECLNLKSRHFIPRIMSGQELP